jgi:DNA-binding transcriptional ArsR family regulator
MGDSHELLAELWVRDVETIKVIADALRLEMLRRMAEPITVKEVAAQLNLPASKLYYHINLLHEHGLIRVVQHNLESGIVEKVYQVSARQFKLVNPLISGEGVPDDAASALFASMLEETQADFQKAYAHRDKGEGTPPRHPFLSKKAFRLTEEQLTALHSQLDMLIKEVTTLGERNNALNEPLYELTVVFYRQPKL